jgi:hypothetical protein
MRDAEVAVESFSKTLQMMKRSQPARKASPGIERQLQRQLDVYLPVKLPGVFPH